jgi:hypothetical protein
MQSGRKIELGDCPKDVLILSQRVFLVNEKIEQIFGVGEGSPVSLHLAISDQFHRAR